MNRLFKTLVVGVTFVFGGMTIAPDLSNVAQAQNLPTPVVKKAPKKITRAPTKKGVKKLTKAPTKKASRKNSSKAAARAAKRAVKKAARGTRVQCTLVDGVPTDCRSVAVKKTVRKIGPRVQCSLVDGTPTDCRAIAAKKTVRPIAKKGSRKSGKIVVPRVLTKALPKKS